MGASKLFLPAVAVFVAICLNGCQKPTKSPEADGSRIRIGAPLAKGQEQPPTVVFDLSPASGHPDSTKAKLYDCTYNARGKTARFQLQLELGAPLKIDVKSAEITEDKIISVSGSENTSFMEDLKTALEAKRMPANVKRKMILPFDW
jgi:hypothetical protein